MSLQDIDISIDPTDILDQISVEDIADYYSDELVDHIKEKHNLIEEE